MEIRKSYCILATPHAVWRALTDPEQIARWGGGPVVMSAEPGSDFSLWGGDISGTVLEAEPERLLVEEWYGGDWDEPSLVRFELAIDPIGSTRLTLEHTGVPDDEAPSFDAGWDDYYLGPLRELLEEEG